MPILEIAVLSSMIYSGTRALKKRTQRRQAMGRVLNNNAAIEQVDGKAENVLTTILVLASVWN